MRPRQTVTELFSSFIKFEQDTFKAWLKVPKLERSIRNILSRHPVTKNQENFLALYWHNLWRQEASPLAREHLVAYLQEVCYWAAYKTVENLKSPKYKLSDCFQIALTQIHVILNGFDSRLGSNLKNYAGVSFRSLLINTLRGSYEAELCSDWALLRKISQRKLESCLTQAGLSPAKIAEYVLSWSCFKIVFAPEKNTGIRQLSRPEAPTWEAISALYNKQRLHQLEPSSPPCSAAKIESRLIKCSQCLRAYLFPRIDSLNTPKPGQENTELLDELAGESESLLTQMIEQEEKNAREQQQIELQSFLRQALNELKPEQLQILSLYYAEHLTQAEIANRLNTKQYTVSRNLTRTRELILKALSLWSQEKFEVTLNGEMIAQMDEVLEQWLESYYQQSITETILT